VSVVTKDIRLALEAAFTMPAVSPMIPLPPYRYKGTKALNVLFNTDPAVAQKLVPAPLKVEPGKPLIFYIGHFQFQDFDATYNEAGLLVPVTCEGKPAGLFAVVLYLDKANPIVGGREIYGWPKKDADEILFQEEKGRLLARVTRYGQQIITATFDSQQLVEKIVQRPNDTFYLLKHVPSIEKDAPPDVLKLNAMVITPDVITEMHTGRSTLQFGESPFDSYLSGIPVGDIIYSELIVHDFTLAWGETVVDYLKEK
jgi:acetoacetate decarboxylase